jgi:CubicO group peptidase (beta-lactamase class C family)
MTRTDRRRHARRCIAWVLLCGTFVAGCAPGPAIEEEDLWPTDGWTEGDAAASGLDTAPLEALDDAIAAGEMGFVDRMLVIRDGRLVFDRRYENDYREISRGFRDAMGCGWESCEGSEIDLEYNYYHPETHPWYRGGDVHSLQSVTKSIAATVVGAAIANGEIGALDTPVLDFFPDRDLSGVDPRLREATLEDLLTMRLGMEWHEQDRPADETNTTIQLERSDDWFAFTFAQPMEAAPGEKWLYNSGASHLMSGIVRHATGRHLDDYAREHLFGPLGIEEFHWKKSPRGFADTEGGLFLKAEDLAKIGWLYLHDGVWDGRRILPEGWAEAATERQAETGNRFGWGYGYQWWRLDQDGVEIWAALGFGGQMLVVLPERGTLGVVNAWNVFDPPARAVRGEFLEALIAATGGAP